MRREAVIADPALEREVHQQVEANVLPQIYRAFHYPVQQREHFKIISYDAGKGYFRAHRDNETPDVAYRRFAMTLNLNTGEYRGGELRFPEFGERSEEHTSELQSLMRISYAVFCLKKQNNQSHYPH